MAVTVEELQILISAEVAEALKNLKSVQQTVKEINKAATAPAKAVNAAVKEATSAVQEVNAALKETTSQATEPITAAMKKEQEKLKKMAEFQQQTAKDIDNAIARLLEKESAERAARAERTAKTAEQEQAAIEARAAMASKQHVTQAPNAPNTPTDSTRQYTLWQQVMRQYYAKLDYIKKQLYGAGLYGNEGVKAVSAATRQATAEMNKYSKSVHTAKKQLTGAGKEGKKSLGYIAGAIRRTIVMSTLYAVLRTVTGGITEGFKNLAQASKEANATMSRLATGALYLKNSIGSALMPIVQALTPAITAIADKLASLLNVFGMLSARIFNNATTYTVAKKAAVDYAKTVKGVANQLAGFDELNVLQQSSTPGMPKPSTMFEQVAIPEETLSLADKIKGVFSGIAEALSVVTNPIKNVFGNIKRYFAENGDAIAATLTRVKDSVIENKNGILAALGGLAAGIGTFKLVSYITQLGGIPGMLAGIKTAFAGLAASVSAPALLIAAGVAIVVAEFIHLCQTSEEFRKSVHEALTQTKEIFLDVWNKWIYPILVKIGAVVTQLWKEDIQPVIDKFLVTWLRFYNEVFAPLVKYLVDTLAPVVQWVADVVLLAVKGVVENASWWLDLFLNVIDGVITFVSGVFTGDWEKAWNGVKDIFGSIWNGIAGIVENVCNFMIRCINQVIKGINSFKIDLSGMPKSIRNQFGDSIGLNIPLISDVEIPRLADGAIVAQPTLAWMGEYAGASSNPEIIAPQSIMRETVVEANAPMVSAMYDMARMIVQAIEENATVVEQDPDAIFKVWRKKSNDYRKLTGRAMY